MRERLRNINKVIRENSKIIVPSIVAIVLLVVVFITLYFYKYNSYHKDEELSFYHYITASREEFTGVLSRNRNNEIISLDIDDEDMIIDSYPIYNEDNDMVIFPSRMNVVYATNELKQYSTNSYAYLYYDVNDYKLIDSDYNNYIKHCFLYDGENLYFFLDEVTLTIGKEEIVLSPLSFVVANSNNNINYYDKESDTYKSIDTKSNDIIVKNDYYKINVMEDKLDYYGNNVLLINDLDYLKHISEE
jgi:hypothetical protein